MDSICLKISAEVLSAWEIILSFVDDWETDWRGFVSGLSSVSAVPLALVGDWETDWRGVSGFSSFWAVSL